MSRILGTLEIKTGYIRVKPNVPFIGSLSGVSCYEINDGLVDIQLAPTPHDRVYLVDYSLSVDAAFLPTENWIIPNHDCTLDEARGLRNFTQSLQLQLEVNKLQLNNEQLTIENEQLKLENQQLKLENKQLQIDNNMIHLEKEKMLGITVEQPSVSSINILKRFL